MTIKTPDARVMHTRLPFPEFEARGHYVFQKPLTRGDRTTMGFRVLEVNENITDGDKVALALAKLMNQNVRDFTDD